MNTLSISQIFTSLDFYQENYLSILASSDYYTPVENAYINVWPLGHVDLYLGDLLQLWFSEKWLINQECLRLADHPDDGRRIPLQREQDLYLYQLSGSALSGSNRCRVWSQSEQKEIRVSLNSALQYYGGYKGTSRPDQSIALQPNALLKSLKSAI